MKLRNGEVVHTQGAVNAIMEDIDHTDNTIDGHCRKQYIKNTSLWYIIFK